MRKFWKDESCTSKRYIDESGTTMIEGALCITAVMIVIVMFMGLGFLCYQHAMMGIVANQVAEEIAVTSKLKNVTSASSVTHTDVIGVRNYRALFMSDFVNANETKAQNLARTRLTATSLAKDNGGYNVSIERVTDDMGRAHYEVVVTNKYVTLFGNGLSSLGFTSSTPYTATAYVAEVDALMYTDYVSTTQCVCTIVRRQSSLLKGLENVAKFIHSITT